MKTTPLPIETDTPITTWFGIGGHAARLARPSDREMLRACIMADPDLLMLGDGANLLVGDGTVDRLVVSLDRYASWTVDENDPTRVIATAGMNLPKLLIETTRLGLAGLEGLAGIPASVGGATIMNAGGSFGEIADSIAAVHAIDRAGQDVTLPRERIDFGYRTSGLHDLIITDVEFALRRSTPEDVRLSLKEAMAYKKGSQPMAEQSAGCAFRNPTLEMPVNGVGERGQRVSAGRLIDLAGCKGMRVGGASVSDQHANFILTAPDACAGDVIELMDLVRRRVLEIHGVSLEAEVVVWPARSP